MNKKENNSIDLRQQLTWRNSMQFPLQSKASRRDILIGGLWLMLPIIGWLINMGHRVRGTSSPKGRNSMARLGEPF